MVRPNRTFILSPASCSGRRAEILLRAEATFDLAARLRTEIALGEAFSFLSGLYFRGKLAYASHFARTRTGLPKVLVITAGRGLLAPDANVTVADLRAFASIPIELREPRYRVPLERDCARLAAQISGEDQVILLGSIASGKYREVLHAAFGAHLRFPQDFVGRGDLSRGGLLLRCVEEDRELEYASFSGATLRGTRPAPCEPRKSTRGKK